MLDDFGAGDTSLTLLRRMPLSAVKIDRSLLRGIGRQGGDSDLVACLIKLARGLGLTALAEGVETEAQRAFVVAAGCEGWQGFLAAPALDAPRLQRRAREAPGVEDAVLAGGR